MTESHRRSHGFLEDLLPTPLQEWKTDEGINNSQCANHFGFSVPAIQKMLTGNREIGVLEVGEDCFKIVETKKIEVLMLCPSLAWDNRNSDLWWSGNGQFAFNEPEAYTIVQIIEPRGARKTKDVESDFESNFESDDESDDAES